VSTVLPRETLLSCVHCGLCLQSCPTYRVLGREADSPRGRIYLVRAMEEGRLAPDAAAVQHLDLCLNCRACETACPAGVRYGEILERARARLRESGAGPPGGPLEAWILGTLFQSRERLEAGVDALRALQRLGVFRWARHRMLRRLLPPAVASGAGLVPPVPSRAERALAVGVYPPYEASSRPRARVGLFATCVVQPLFPGVNRALLHLLRVAGCEVAVPEAQGCCGSLHAHAGLRHQALRRARAALRDLPEQLDAVVTASAGCGATMKEYEHLFEPPAAGPGERARARAFAARVRDGLEFLDEIGLPDGWEGVAGRVTVHDPCHLAHAQRVRQAPRRLLARVAGLELVEMRHSDWCCGSAGTYNLKHPEIADRLLDEKLDAVAATGAPWVAVANPGCLLYMVAGGSRRGLAARFAHPLEILARAYPWPRPAIAPSGPAAASRGPGPAGGRTS
jgi:glycolate oxidase iron-sulfur subunit